MLPLRLINIQMCISSKSSICVFTKQAALPWEWTSSAGTWNVIVSKSPTAPRDTMCLFFFVLFGLHCLNSQINEHSNFTLETPFLENEWCFHSFFITPRRRRRIAGVEPSMLCRRIPLCFYMVLQIKNTDLNNLKHMSNIPSLDRDCTLLDAFTIPSSCQATLDLYWAALIQCELKDGPTLLGSGELGTGEQVPAMFTLVSPAILPPSSVLLLNAEEIPKWRASAKSRLLSKEAYFNLDSYFGFEN